MLNKISALLEANGFTQNDTVIVSFNKNIESSVGIKSLVLPLYELSFSNEFSYKIMPEFSVRGDNILHMHNFDLPQTASNDELEKIISEYVSEINEVIHNSMVATGLISKESKNV